jgi:hypothetical protein
VALMVWLRPATRAVGKNCYWILAAPIKKDNSGDILFHQSFHAADQVTHGRSLDVINRTELPDAITRTAVAECTCTADCERLRVRCRHGACRAKKKNEGGSKEEGTPLQEGST